MPDDPKPEGANTPESAPQPEPASSPSPSASPQDAAAESAPQAAVTKSETAAPAAAGEGTPAGEIKPPAAAATKPPATPAEKPPAAAAAKPAAAAPAAKPAAPAAPKAPPVMAVTPWESELTADLAAEFGDQITAFQSYLGQNFLICKSGAAVPILESLRDNYGFDYLVDVTAVHYPNKPEPFELIHIVYSFERNERIRLKTLLKDGEKAASAVPVYITADWLEREVYDMFGIEFEGHPNMKRILLPDEWSTFPLRKENSILNMDQRWVQENLGIESGQ